MKYICKEDLKSDIKTCGDPELEGNAEYLANKIMEELGNGNGLVGAKKAKDRIHNLMYGNKLYEDHMPKTIFDSPYFTPDEIVQYIDSQLTYIKDKYTPYGLELPFSSLEDAHSWIRNESSTGILSTDRIHCPALDINDMSIYKASMITMPYRNRVSHNGLNVKDTVTCNWSPFLIELNDMIDRLSRMTGVDKIEILNRFLTNKSIERPRVKAVIASDTFNQYLTIQINVNDLSKEEWDEIYDAYRINTKRKHKKRLSDRNIKLTKMLEDMEVPEKPNADFCRKLIKKWNKETGEDMDIEKWRTMYARLKAIKEYKEEMPTFKSSILNQISKI